MQYGDIDELTGYLMENYRTKNVVWILDIKKQWEQYTSPPAQLPSVDSRNGCLLGLVSANILEAPSFDLFDRPDYSFAEACEQIKPPKGWAVAPVRPRDILREFDADVRAELEVARHIGHNNRLLRENLSRRGQVMAGMLVAHGVTARQSGSNPPNMDMDNWEALMKIIHPGWEPERPFRPIPVP